MKIFFGVSKKGKMHKTSLSNFLLGSFIVSMLLIIVSLPIIGLFYSLGTHKDNLIYIILDATIGFSFVSMFQVLWVSFLLAIVDKKPFLDSTQESLICFIDSCNYLFKKK